MTSRAIVDAWRARYPSLQYDHEWADAGHLSVWSGTWAKHGDTYRSILLHLQRVVETGGNTVWCVYGSGLEHRKVRTVEQAVELLDERVRQLRDALEPKS